VSIIVFVKLILNDGHPIGHGIEIDLEGQLTLQSQPSGETGIRSITEFLTLINWLWKINHASKPLIIRIYTATVSCIDGC